MPIKKTESEQDKEKMTKIRWQIPLVLMISLMVSYFDRMNITFALPMIARDYGWTVAETGKYGGMLMSMFFIGYGIATIFLSPIGERFGAKNSIITIVVLFSIVTCLQAPFGMILTAFVAIRVLLGLVSGIHGPMMGVLTEKWFPINERSRANSIWFCGIFAAMILAPVIVVPLCEVVGWKMMFVVIGIVGMIITLPLLKLLVYESPEEHPKISKSEISYIQKGRIIDTEKETALSFMSSVKFLWQQKIFWLVIILGIMNNMIAFGLLSWMPTFFTEGRKLAFSHLVYATSLPYILSIVGALSWAYFGDKTNKRGYLSCIAFLGTGIMICLAATTFSIPLIIFYFAATIFFSAAYNANEIAFIQRIVPSERTGTGIGIYLGISMMLGGGLGPVVVGSVVSATGSYDYGLITLAGVCLVCSFLVFFLGRKLKY
ncbi:MAG TPA: MFS transporter [Smithellaceae bacterium]|nr:MFS transporter [Smithellaceae bacterium]